MNHIPSYILRQAKAARTQNNGEESDTGLSDSLWDDLSDSDSDSSMPSLEENPPHGTQDPFEHDQLDEYTQYYEEGISIQSFLPIAGTGGTLSNGMTMNVITGEEDWGM